jgi:hypothetical protein
MKSRLLHPAFAVAVVVLGASALGFTAVIGAMRIHLQKLPIHPPGERQVSAIPVETESWKRVGPDRLEDAAMLEELGTRNYLSRVYTQKSAPQGKKAKSVELHLAYYTGMVDTVPHVPERCMVGGGWSLGGSSEVIPLALDEAGWLEDKDVPSDLAGRVFTGRLSNGYSDAGGQRVHLPFDPRALQLRITPFKGPGRDRPMYAGYFFIANGGHKPNADEVRLLAFDLKDDYAYYLKVQVSSSEVESAAELAQLASSLLGELLPEIMRCVPDWVAVQRGDYPADNPRRDGRSGGTGV